MVTDPHTPDIPPSAARDDLARFIEVLRALDLGPADVQVYAPAHPWFDAGRPLLVLPAAFDAARAASADRYPADHPARVVIAGVARPALVSELPAEADAWLIEPLPAEEDARALRGLRAVMERLYGPAGCPWDREQTHETLRTYLLEESYEPVDAIDRGDLEALREELGDLLAHLFMHTAMAQEAGEFALEDVTESAVRKMVRRHPHVFGDEAAGSNEELLARWDQIKAAERGAAGGARNDEAPGALASVPLAAPALQRAQSLQQRAVRAGALEPARDGIAALALAVDELAAQPDPTRLGAALWAAVRVARELDVDAEEALRTRATAFASAFAALEREARAVGAPLDGLPVERRALPWASAPAPRTGAQ